MEGFWGSGGGGDIWEVTYTTSRDCICFLCAFCRCLGCDGGDAESDEGEDELHFAGWIVWLGFSLRFCGLV